MIYLKQAVIVEGKYDKIKLKNFLDCEIIVTDGFRVFRDREKCNMIRRIAENKGIIILTDSDSAGFLIRGYLTGIVDSKYITNVFVPEIKGKERRKPKQSAEGLLGVEGISEQAIVDAFSRAGVDIGRADCGKSFKWTSADLFKLGLSGGKDSRLKREKLMKKLKLPIGMSTNQLLTALNSLYEFDEIAEILRADISD